ncbi:hypothetical protein KFE98_08210 [bacterium SCSIO 12741]|nr:hypothetical protein KFE98_08210 [bacterium SCSIO 12741]
MENYLQPDQISVPQTNFQLGYYLSDHYSISIGFDHMKYVMTRIQNVNMEGYIRGTDTDYDGVYQNEQIELTPLLLTYEHSDGLNYLFAEFSRHDRALTLWDNAFQIEMSEGLGAGALYPRTASRFLVNELADDYHFAGYGFHGRVGIQFLLFKYVSIQTNLKGGFIHLPDVVTSNRAGEGARQHFWYLQGNLLFGVSIPVFHRAN